MFGLTGGPDNELVSGSTKPLIYRKPDSASQTDAYPGLDDQGPVCPYPLTRVNMSEGLSGRKADGPKPHFSNAEYGQGIKTFDIKHKLPKLTPWLEVFQNDITLGRELFHEPVKIMWVRVKDHIGGHVRSSLILPQVNCHALFVPP